MILLEEQLLLDETQFSYFLWSLSSNKILGLNKCEYFLTFG